MKKALEAFLWDVESIQRARECYREAHTSGDYDYVCATGETLKFYYQYLLDKLDLPYLDVDIRAQALVPDHVVITIDIRMKEDTGARLLQRHNVELYMNGRQSEITDSEHTNLLDAVQDINDNAPDDLRALLGEVERLQAELDGIDEYLRYAADMGGIDENEDY